MYCSKCNKTLPDDATFCDTCGSKLESNPTSNAPFNPTAQPSSNPQFNPNPQPNLNPQPEPRNYSYNPPPAYAPPADNQMTTGKWVGIFLLNIIPVVGWLIYIILIFKWAFGSCRYPSLKSFAKAMLILALIGIILGIIFTFTLAPIMNDLINNFGGGFELFKMNDLGL